MAPITLQLIKKPGFPVLSPIQSRQSLVHYKISARKLAFRWTFGDLAFLVLRQKAWIVICTHNSTMSLCLMTVVRADIPPCQMAADNWTDVQSLFLARNRTSEQSLTAGGLRLTCVPGPSPLLSSKRNEIRRKRSLSQRMRNEVDFEALNKGSVSKGRGRFWGPSLHYSYTLLRKLSNLRPQWLLSAVRQCAISKWDCRTSTWI